MSLSRKGEHADSRSRPLQEFSVPLRSRSSHDSDDSLRALEILEGAAPSTLHRGRPVSMSSFSFERDLVPLTASLSEPDEIRTAVAEKSIGLINGTQQLPRLELTLL
jgi:hypothetical protein